VLHCKEPKAQFSNNPTCSRFNMNRRRGHRSYTKGISKLITIGRGPESLLRRPSMVTQEPDSDSYYHYLREDIVEKEDWRCFHTVNGEHHWSIWHMVPNECTTELVVILMCKDLIWSVLLKQAFESLRMSQLRRCSLLANLSSFPISFFLWVAQFSTGGRQTIISIL
jgi:hypothetical protein